MSRKVEVGSGVKSIAEASAYRVEGKLCCRLTIGVFIIKHENSGI